MKKIAVLLVLGALAATPAVAASKKKPTPAGPHQMIYDEAMAYNKSNLSLVVQALSLVLPTCSLPIYFGMHKDADKAKPDKRKKH